MIRRREVITSLAGAAAWPSAMRAQQSTGRRIGYLGATTAAAEAPRTQAFLGRLRELGWMEGHSVAIEYRWAEGRYERFAEVAAEFIRMKVDLILASSTAAALSSKHATAAIPIVFGLAGDPLATGLVANLARPGGNVTGFSNQAADLAGKRIEMLREVAPTLRRLAVLANASYPGALPEIQQVRAAADVLALEVVAFPIKGPEELIQAFESMSGRAEALYVVGDTLLNSNRIGIAILAAAAHLPTMYVEREYVAAGGLMSYGANIPNLFRRAAEYVDKIFRGARAGDLPVEQPTKFDLSVNLVTARAIGLNIPATLLARADEVIE